MKVQCIVTTLMAVMFVSCSKPAKHQYQGYIEGENVYLASPYSGVLKNLFVQRGEQVKQGQLLFQLDTDPQALIVEQSQAAKLQAERVLKDLENPRRLPEIEAIEAQIGQTDAEKTLAELRVKRYQQLYARQATDKDTLDAAIANLQEKQQLLKQYQANLELAKLGSREEQISAQKEQVKASEAKLNQAKWQLHQKQVYAPAEGFIFDTYYRVGEFVANEQAVLTLLPPKNVRVEFFVPVEELKNIYNGQKICFVCYGCHVKSNATINYISPEAQYMPPLVYSRDNADKIVFRIKAVLEQPGLFKPGQPVTVILP